MPITRRLIAFVFPLAIAMSAIAQTASVAGASTTFFVSQQQEILSNTEVREASAQSDYAKALAEYDRQLGLTLEKLNITLDPPR